MMGEPITVVFVLFSGSLVLAMYQYINNNTDDIDYYMDEKILESIKNSTDGIKLVAFGYYKRKEFWNNSTNGSEKFVYLFN